MRNVLEFVGAFALAMIAAWAFGLTPTLRGMRSKTSPAPARRRRQDALIQGSMMGAAALAWLIGWLVTGSTDDALLWAVAPLLAVSVGALLVLPFVASHIAARKARAEDLKRSGYPGGQVEGPAPKM